jgi:hypothetical protein
MMPFVIRTPWRSPSGSRRFLNFTPGARPTIEPSTISDEHRGQFTSAFSHVCELDARKIRALVAVDVVDDSTVPIGTSDG